MVLFFQEIASGVKKAPQVKDFIMRAHKPFEKLQMDITYIFVQGENKNALFLALEDVFSRKVLSYKVNWTMRKYEVISLLDEVLLSIDQIPVKIIIRTDRGPQFMAYALADFLKSVGIEHELTKPHTPQQNAFIESFFSIFKREVIAKIDFDSLTHLQEIVEKYVNFYNKERIHAGLGYMSPEEFLKNFLNKSKGVRVFLNQNLVQEIGG